MKIKGQPYLIKIKKNLKGERGGVMIEMHNTYIPYGSVLADCYSHSLLEFKR